MQLELDPIYIRVERTAEIELRRNTILRKIVTGGSAEWRKEKRFRPITLDVALSSLLDSSYRYLRRNTGANGYKLDLLVGRTLKKALPYLQGEEGHFESFGDFKWRMFMSITRHVVVDHYHNKSRSHKETRYPDDQLSAETRKRKADGFQLTLFRLGKDQTRTEQVIAQVLADLKNPERVSGTDYLVNSPRYRKRALELRLQNQQFTSRDIVEILRGEGYREFEESSIRIWVLRAKRAQIQKQLTGI